MTLVAHPEELRFGHKTEAAFREWNQGGYEN
jgi:hypothetical protein